MKPFRHRKHNLQLPEITHSGIISLNTDEGVRFTMNGDAIVSVKGDLSITSDQLNQFDDRVLEISPKAPFGQSFLEIETVDGVIELEIQVLPPVASYRVVIIGSDGRGGDWDRPCWRLKIHSYVNANLISDKSMLFPLSSHQSLPIDFFPADANLGWTGTITAERYPRVIAGQPNNW
jgi:hypothetical protein